MESTFRSLTGKTNRIEMGADSFTRSASVERDKRDLNSKVTKVARQISIDSGIAEYEDGPLKILSILDSEDELSEDEDFEDALDFDE